MSIMVAIEIHQRALDRIAELEAEVARLNGVIGDIGAVLGAVEESAHPARRDGRTVQVDGKTRCIECDAAIAEGTLRCGDCAQRVREW